MTSFLYCHIPNFDLDIPFDLLAEPIFLNFSKKFLAKISLTLKSYQNGQGRDQGVYISKCFPLILIFCPGGEPGCRVPELLPLQFYLDFTWIHFTWSSSAFELCRKCKMISLWVLIPGLEVSLPQVLVVFVGGSWISEWTVLLLFLGMCMRDGGEREVGERPLGGTRIIPGSRVITGP